MKPRRTNPRTLSDRAATCDRPSFWVSVTASLIGGALLMGIVELLRKKA